MRCVNCGADFSVNGFKCPFCGTENPEAERRENIKKKKRDLFYALRIRTILESGPEMVTKVLTRILLVNVGVLALSLLILFFLIWTEDSGVFIKKLPISEHVANLEDIKKTGDYGELSGYMEKYDLSVYDGAEEYWQLYYLDEDLFSFRRYREMVERMTPEQTPDDTYRIDGVLRYACKIAGYEKNDVEWTKLYEDNKAIYQKSLEEVKVGLMVTCRLTSAEVGELFDFDSTNTADYEAIIPIIKERVMDREPAE